MLRVAGKGEGYFLVAAVVLLCMVAARCSVAWTNSYHLVLLAFSSVIHTLRAEHILGHVTDTLTGLTVTSGRKPQAWRRMRQLPTMMHVLGITI